jgi:hypothetical protein
LVSFPRFCRNSRDTASISFSPQGQTRFSSDLVGGVLAFFARFSGHPKRLALAPLTGVYLGWDLLAWGSRPGWLGAINDWWLQLAVLLVLLVVYATGARRGHVQPAAVAASCALLIGIQLLTLFPSVGY